MTRRRPELAERPDPDQALREAIVGAVERAPLAHAWIDVERLATLSPGEAPRSRWTPFVAVAAVLMLAVAGGVFVLTRSDSQTVRTDDPVSTTAPAPSTSSTAVATTAPTPAVGSVKVSLPRLPDALNRSWSTTIEGSYPQSAVRIGETIIFGQQDLPGVRAVDARSGDLLWSFTVVEPDATIVDLRVIDDHAILSWMDSNAAHMVTALNAAGDELWSATSANSFSGAVLRQTFVDDEIRLELLDADGVVQRWIGMDSLVSSTDDQVVIERDDGFSWYRLPTLERLAGPITFASRPDALLATVDDIVALDGTVLRFLDQTGRLRSELRLERAGLLHAVGGERPGIIMVVPDNRLPNVGGRQEGTTTFYALVDDVITPVWTQVGVFEELFELDGRARVVFTVSVDGSSDDTMQHLIDAATGGIVVSNDLYDTDGAANGFVFAQLDNGPNDVQSVAYDPNGREKWRLLFEGRERAEVVDQGALVALPDTVAQTVDLTFYD